MTKTLLLLTAVLLASTGADAATRLRVVPVDRTNAEILCPWVSMSVPPDTPAGHYTLGVCPPRNVARPY